LEAPKNDWGFPCTKCHVALRSKRERALAILIRKEREALMNDWNNTEWFRKWLKLARGHRERLEKEDES